MSTDSEHQVLKRTRDRPAYDQAIHQRADDAIAHGSLTNSKRPRSFVLGIYPTHLTKGLGCFVWDTQGNKYFDFICGLGTNLLGYANEEIERAVITQAKKGFTLSLGTDLEIRCAEKVKEFFPFIEKLRFLKTGSEACTAAVRIARAYTDRSLVWSQGYHGWHDEFVSLTSPGLGNTVNSFSMSQLWEESPFHSAAVIVEPIMTDSSPRRIAKLIELERQCQQEGALLIFDEIVTGLRFSESSVTRAYGLKPDLVCLGKALGGGLPLSLVGGKADVMEGTEYFVSSTCAGETLSLAACLRTLELLQTKYKISVLWEKGERFQREFNSLWNEGIWLEGYPTRGVWKAKDPLTQALFFQEACRSGILIGPSFFLSFPHLDHLDMVINMLSDIVSRIKCGSVKLEGEMPVQPYAEKVRAS